MDDKLKAELTTWLASLRGEVGGARKFLLEQAPDFLQEVVLYGRITTSLAMLGVIAMALVLAWTARVCIRNRRPWFLEDDGEIKPEIMAPIMGLMTGVAVAAVLFGANIGAFISVWFAPKMYIVEYLATLAK